MSAGHSKRRCPRFLPPTLLAAALALVALGIHSIYHAVTTTVPNCYAAWWVADMVVEHMKSHDGAWPRGWEDLSAPYEACVERSGRHWTFEELQQRVDVDWQADPKVLAEASNDERPPFRVIWLRDGSSTYWNHAEPNGIVWEYLHAHRPE